MTMPVTTVKMYVNVRGRQKKVWFILGRILCLDRGANQRRPIFGLPTLKYEPFIITQLGLLSRDKKNHLIMMRIPIASMS